MDWWILDMWMGVRMFENNSCRWDDNRYSWLIKKILLKTKEEKIYEGI